MCVNTLRYHQGTQACSERVPSLSTHLIRKCDIVDGLNYKENNIRLTYFGEINA